jgi:hypothetical protein
VPGRDRDARELRAVAPLFADGTFVGPVLLVHHAGRTIGATEPELLRPYVGATLRVVTRLDGGDSAAVVRWGLSRNGELALVELAEPVARGLDVRPLALGCVGATVDPHGSPAALVGISRDGAGFARAWVPVVVDRDDGGMSDQPQLVASPIEDAHVGLVLDGAALFAWFPPSPALGRPEEISVLAVGRAYRGFAKPRERPVVAGLVGLDDLGRALISSQPSEEREELGQVAGELEAREAPPGHTGAVGRGGRRP